MNAIVAVSQNWGIGRDNRLLFSLPTDMKHFRATTLNATVIMGRNTLLSLPNRRPLPKRRNLILSTSLPEAEGLEVLRSIPELLERVAGLDRNTVWVMGGCQVYRDLLPYCDRVVLTRVYADAAADCFFPDLDALGWRAEARGAVQEENGLRFRFFDYYPPHSV